MPDRHIIEFPPRVRQASTRLFFGGSFDPPHLGHTRLPQSAAQRMNTPSQVVYVPAGRSPFKPTNPTDPTHRLAMLKLGLREYSESWIWPQELTDFQSNPDKPNYWANTWALVREQNFKGTNRFLIGADQAVQMHRWHRYTEFWQDAIVMLRAQTDSLDALLEQLIQTHAWNKQDIEHWRSRVLVLDPVEASSSAIREALSDPTRRQNPINALDQSVHTYILEHGLYL